MEYTAPTRDGEGQGPSWRKSSLEARHCLTAVLARVVVSRPGNSFVLDAGQEEGTWSQPDICFTVSHGVSYAALSALVSLCVNCISESMSYNL